MWGNELREQNDQFNYSSALVNKKGWMNYHLTSRSD
ncbi:hypothetical protein PVOR_18729 [Paenibacillus vortex V453]|uniref:Uncharacterized protein n=1 Tax=Paenibacillus vortex V453 TaxID=715225 RepID=A0A2R9SU71_9BACL|nr:hypothetical protein PVOR_18729 [Paenibacillus vortex V453]